MFWPFLLGDIFSYALWPYDYYYPFWSYGTAYNYDYGPYLPAHGYYGYNDLSNVYGYTGTAGDSRNDTGANQIPPEVTQSCGGFAPGVTNFPIDRIRQAIHPTGEQVTFLDDLATASSTASAVLNASCPNQPPLTPLARLDAVERRLEATIRAIEIVRTAVATLYDSLNDEQRQRLDAIGAEDIGCLDRLADTLLGHGQLNFVLLRIFSGESAAERGLPRCSRADNHDESLAHDSFFFG